MPQYRSLFSKPSSVSVGTSHSIRFDKSADEWGRGIYHTRTKTVYVWPESEGTHWQQAKNLGLSELHCEGLYVSPISSLTGKDREVSRTGSFYDTEVFDTGEMRDILDSLGFNTINL